MEKFLIERTLPGAGSLTAEQLTEIARRSNDVLAAMGGRAQWLESYVSDDKVTCVYLADDPESLREHAAGGGFPMDATLRVRTVVDPKTAEAVEHHVSVTSRGSSATDRCSRLVPPPRGYVVGG